MFTNEFSSKFNEKIKLWNESGMKMEQEWNFGKNDA